MYRFIGSLAVCATIAVAPAIADDNPPSAGAKGTITAWDESGTKVLEHRYCVKTSGSWDYVSCGNRVRDRLKLQLCSERGPGLHRYLYQVGDGKPSTSSVFCKS